MVPVLGSWGARLKKTDENDESDVAAEFAASLAGAGERDLFLVPRSENFSA